MTPDSHSPSRSTPTDDRHRSRLGRDRSPTSAPNCMPRRPTATAAARSPSTPSRRLRASGLTSALVPREFGGGGASHAEMGAVLRSSPATTPPTAVTLSMHSHLVAAQVWRHHHGLDASAVFAQGGRRARHPRQHRRLRLGRLQRHGPARSTAATASAPARRRPAAARSATSLVTSIRWDDGPDGPQVLHCAVPFAADGVSIDRRGTRSACAPPARTPSCSTTSSCPTPRSSLDPARRRSGTRSGTPCSARPCR